MLITELEVINGCLATLGETPLNSLDDDHTYKPAAQNFLVDANREMQARGWWFNTETIKLDPDATTKRISIPQDALVTRPIQRITPPHGNRGKYLYDTTNNTLEWESSVYLEVVRCLDFDDLPYTAANLVKYDAITKFQKEYDADAQKLRILAEQRIEARTNCVAEDIRNRKSNLLATPSHIASMLDIVGYGSRGTRIPIR